MKFSATLLATAYAASGTDYSLQGENWEDICATGQRQSPIDIHPGHSNHEFNFNPFMPVNYDRSNTWDVTLEGGIKMTPNADDITWVPYKSIMSDLISDILVSPAVTSDLNINLLNFIFTGVMISVVDLNTLLTVADTFLKSTLFISTATDIPVWLPKPLPMVKVLQFLDISLMLGKFKR